LGRRLSSEQAAAAQDASRGADKVGPARQDRGNGAVSVEGVIDKQGGDTGVQARMLA
jgi:hypothetical protein